MQESKSPIIQELREEWTREGALGAKRQMILDLLIDRFGPEARKLEAQLKSVSDDARLKELNKLAVTCPDLESFRKAIAPPRRRRKA
jgi:hypothetical protein